MNDYAQIPSKLEHAKVQKIVLNKKECKTFVRPVIAGTPYLQQIIEVKKNHG